MKNAKFLLEFIATVIVPCLIAPKFFIWISVPRVFASDELTLSWQSLAFVLCMAIFTGLAVYGSGHLFRSIKEKSASK